MRISKIFHWLYASVMLMPIFAIGVKCLYTMINQNAKESYYGETINENEYITRNYFVSNQYLYFDKATQVSYNNIQTDYILCDILEFNTQRSDIQTWYESHQDNIGGIRFIVVSNQVRINFYDLNNTYIDYWGLSSDSYFIKMYTKNGGSLGENYNNFYTIEYNYYSYLDNVFYYSVDQINNEPLFSWAQSSFLSQPLLFITNFFGVPSTSPILTILCYWFSISVIWLVFDAVMYFPLLIHRWLDKGVLE